MTDVRRGTAADIPRLVELGQAMHAESPRFSPYRFDPERLAGSLRGLLDMPLGLVLVAEHDGLIVGGMLAIAADHYACEFRQAADLALFVDADRRGGAAAVRLINAYRQWAREIGAEASICPSTGIEQDRTGRLLHALGAHAAATVWVWRD
jgi:GNAT superfamily N-acetyltransferase